MRWLVVSPLSCMLAHKEGPVRHEGRGKDSWHRLMTLEGRVIWVRPVSLRSHRV